MAIPEEGREAHVLIIPYPAQGHMIPLLDLAHLLSLHNLAITIAVTPKNLPLLSPLLASSPSVKPLILPFPNYPSLPPNIENAKDLPHSVSNFLHIMHALSRLHSPILQWARSVPNPPVAILSDFFLGWTYKLAQQLSTPRITFCPSGALSLAISNYLWRRMPPEADAIRFESLPGSPVYEWSQISSIYRSYVEGDPLSEFVKEGFVGNIDSWGYVFNTFEDLEAKYLDHMREDLGHGRVWAVGPLSLRGPGSAAERGGPSSVPAEELLSWLDGKEEGSVVYVCFGSQATLSQAQVDAVEAALERSGVRFVWCLRAGPAAAGPKEGFEERVKERGTVVIGWAPQVEVLGHKAVGWFLTHCGWNSVLEGIAAGTAMLTWPMGADQFYNARVLEEEVGTGVRVCQGRESVPDSDRLATILAETVSGGDREERRRAVELKGKALAAVEEGGSSWRDVEALVEELKKLKGDNFNFN